MTLRSWNNRDLVAGVVLIACGALVAVHSIRAYDLGSLAMMGPGAFPAWLGGMLAVLGAWIAIQGMLRGVRFPTIEIASLVAVTASAAIFALTIRSLGYVPSIALSTIVAALASRRRSPIAVVGVTVGLCILCYLVFFLGLGIPLPAFRLPL